MRALVRFLGGVLAVACVAWIIWRFVQQGVLTKLWDDPRRDSLLLWVGIAAAVYSGCIWIMGLGWWCSLRAVHEGSLPIAPLMRVYVSSQFGKYLPGNVAQFVGRHIMARRHGIGHAPLVASLVIEIVSLLSAASVWGGGELAGMAWGDASTVRWWHVLIVVVVLGAGAARVLQVWAKRSVGISRWLPMHSPIWLVPAAVLHLAFFTVMGLCMLAVAKHLSGASEDSLWIVPSAIAAAWATGFVTIGAPAGIGVRELVLVAILRGAYSEGDALLLAASLRAVTFGGDVLSLLQALLLGRWMLNRAQRRPILKRYVCI